MENEFSGEGFDRQEEHHGWTLWVPDFLHPCHPWTEGYDCQTLTTFVMPNQDPETVKQYKDEWYVKNREAMLKRKQQHPVAKKKQHPPPSRQ